MHLNHLCERGRRRVDDVVGQNHGERLVPDEGSRDEDGVPEAERLALTHVRKVDQIGDLPNFTELVRLAALFEEALQLDGDVEVILDGVLSAAGDEDDVVDAGGDRLLDAVLDDWLVHERQHFLRLGLGGRKEPRAETRRGEDHLPNLTRHPHRI